MNTLRSPDYAVFLIYFLTVAGYGYWIYTKKKAAAVSSTDYFLAEGGPHLVGHRRLPVRFEHLRRADDWHKRFRFQTGFGHLDLRRARGVHPPHRDLLLH